MRAINAAAAGLLLVCSFAFAANSEEPPLERGVISFFQAFEAEGTIGADQKAQHVYDAFDRSPSQEALESAAGFDIAAYVFRANLSRPANYAPEATSALVQRQDKRLQRYYPNTSERQEIMVSWLKRVKDRMFKQYKEAERK